VLRPDPKSVRFFLDFIGRHYPKAKSIGVNDFTDLTPHHEIHRANPPACIGK